ncbi:putative MATE family efflux protein [Variovorax paradoxus]|uniref:MATE family efflux protein n=1 Tax=Variovorax paradoxus TaxID=34073 RepID=A0AAW8EBB7_VARPD|nr:MATE family efflux transporter [Variovorax paradoxus]MDP9969857.1 putative MATE family efflux protein [Variovorax paradoxus]
MRASPENAATGQSGLHGTPVAPVGAPRALWKTFLFFLSPMLLSNILQSMSGTINNIYIGQMIGVGALAAVSSFFPVMFFFIAFVIGLGAGASVLIGQAWGARDAAKAKAIAGTALSVGILLGLAVAVFGGAFTTPLLSFLGTPPDVLADSTRYARIMLIAMPGLFVFLLSTAMLRGVGDTVTPLLTLLISTGTGLVVTPALIRGWGGLPQLGVASAAWASVLAFVLATLWLGWRLRRRGSPLAPDAQFIRHLRIDPKLLKAVLKVGIPTGVQMIVVALAEVALLSLVNSYGSSATAAYGAVNQVVAYVQFPAISIAITASILGAQAIGAGRADRLGAIAKTALLMNLVLTGGLVLLGYLFSRHLMGFFITSAPVIEIAQTLLHIMLWSLVIFGMASAISGIMRASGSVLVPTAISILCLIGIEVPVAWFMSHRIGLNGIWWAYPVTFGAMLLLQTAYYRLVWRKKAIRRLV